MTVEIGGAYESNVVVSGEGIAAGGGVGVKTATFLASGGLGFFGLGLLHA